MDSQMPPDDQHRDVVIRINRETLILAAALLFLLLAVLLAVMFPNESATTSPATGTSLASSTDQAVAQGERATTTGGVVGEPDTPASSAYPQPQEPQVPDAEQGATSYPAPQEEAPQRQTTPTQLGSTSATPPPFSPSRPTTGAPSVPAGSYPPPGGSGTSQQPTDDLPVVDVPEPTDAPTSISRPQATQPPPPTTRPQATQAPQPTAQPFESADSAATEAPTAPPPTAAPTALPVNVLRGEVRWTAAQSPVILGMDQQVAPGAALIIEPGVEVRLLPGVAIYVDGSVFALGQPGNQVRFVNHENARWDGIYGQPGSTISLEHTEIRGGGSGGTVLASEGGALSYRGGRITDNGGHVFVNNSRLDMQQVEISGNDIPYGAPLDATYNNGGNVTLIGNRIGGNRLTFGAPQAQIDNQGAGVVGITIQSNLMIGQDGPNLVLSTAGPIQGDLTCNTWINGLNGLSIRSQTIQVPGFALNVRDNAIEDHTPPIIPIYLEYGIGRGATSEVVLDMRNNWWDSPLGPYEPDRHADGRGDAVGENIAFDPWLTERPACAPVP